MEDIYHPQKIEEEELSKFPKKALLSKLVATDEAGYPSSDYQKREVIQPPRMAATTAEQTNAMLSSNATNSGPHKGYGNTRPNPNLDP